MAVHTFRVDINISFEIDSDDIDEWLYFQANRDDTSEGGPAGNLRAERRFLEKFLGKERVDILLQWDLLHRADGLKSIWKLHRTIVKSGTDGEFVSPNVFKSSAVSLVSADVGRVLHVKTPSTPALCRGHYLITARSNNSEIEIDGIVQSEGTDLTFDIRERGEVTVTLLSSS